jgi:hypothetical protein
MSLSSDFPVFSTAAGFIACDARSECADGFDPDSYISDRALGFDDFTIARSVSYGCLLQHRTGMALSENTQN